MGLKPNIYSSHSARLVRDSASVTRACNTIVYVRPLYSSTRRRHLGGHLIMLDLLDSEFSIRFDQLWILIRLRVPPAECRSQNADDDRPTSTYIDRVRRSREESVCRDTIVERHQRPTPGPLQDHLSACRHRQPRTGDASTTEHTAASIEPGTAASCTARARCHRSGRVKVKVSRYQQLDTNINNWSMVSGQSVVLRRPFTDCRR